MTLSPREIEDRFEEAALTLRRLPEKDRPRGFHSAWGRKTPPRSTRTWTIIAAKRASARQKW